MARPFTLCCVIALPLTAADLPAQSASDAAQGNSPAVRVMHGLRTEGVLGEARSVLRSLGGEWTRQHQEELADSLTAHVLTFIPSHGGQIEDNAKPSHVAAFETLFAAVSAEGDGVPLAGGERWMRRIAESGVAGYVQHAVFTIGFALPDSTESFHSLEHLARHTGPGPAAVYAVQHLASTFGELGLAALRRLHEESSAGTPQARRMVDYLARHGGGESLDFRRFPTPADSSSAAASAVAAHVMLRIRILAESGRALFVLRGFRDEWTQEQQDAVADSLTAFIIEAHADDRWESLQAARQVLLLSGWTEGYGTPYRGAEERLRRISLGARQNRRLTPTR